MSSQILQEGFLDIKVPRGREDRKLWKVWRQQWARFSVLYPSGRGEPYLVLELGQNSVGTPDNCIRISRDGLRLFRCRSKSRPYRTWAMMSGKKLLLFFAADNEIMAQEWMEIIRDGLWPPCFSFQMLTAYAHAVSLIDDEKTFRSGLLGAYGRLVLMSDEAISLVHPYWGATQLQIPLANVQDVHLVRELETSSTGVFSIVFKCSEDFTLRSLHFYCSTASDAIQWIMSKLYIKELHPNQEVSEIKQSNPKSDCFEASREAFSQKSCQNKSLTSSLVKSSVDIETNEAYSNVSTGPVVTSPEYENVDCLNTSIYQNGDMTENRQSEIELNVSKEISPQTSTTQFSVTKSSTEVCGRQMFSASETNIMNSSTDTFYENLNYDKDPVSVITEPTYENANTYHSSDINTGLANVEILNSNFLLNPNAYRENCSNDELNVSEYATVNKGYLRDLQETAVNKNLSDDNVKYNTFNKDQHFTLSKRLSDSTTDNISMSSKNFSDIEHKNSKNFSPSLNFTNGKLECSSNVQEPLNWAPYSIVNKPKQSVIKSCLEEANLSQSVTKASEIKETNRKHQGMNKFRLLPDIPDDLLDISLNSNGHTLDINTGSFSSGDSETSSQREEDQCDDKEFASHIYEHILQRSYTVYEEIDDSSEDDGVNDSKLPPPQLPERPSNLELPSSLRLQKLSESIKVTLKELERNPSPTRNNPHSNFVKKIKDFNRVMQFSPSKEIADESNFSKRFPSIDTKNAPTKSSEQNGNFGGNPILSSRSSRYFLQSS